MENEKKEEKKSSGNLRKYATLAVIGLVLVLSVVQAFQINEIEEDFADAGVTAAGSSSSSTTTTSAASSRPQMVGGC